jgi:hypothetical protein
VGGRISSRGERGHRGVQLSDAAVDQQNVGERIAIVAQPLKTPPPTLVDAAEIVDPLHLANAEPTVARLERQPSMNRTKLATVSPPCRCAMSTPSIVRGVSASFSTFAQPAQPLLRINVKHFRLDVGVDLAAAVERFEQMDFVAEPCRLFELDGFDGQHLAPHSFEQKSCLRPSRNIWSRRMSRRYSSRSIRKLHGRTLMDARQQTGPEPLPTRIVRFDVEAARAELEDPLQHLQRPAERRRLANGPYSFTPRSFGCRVTSTRGKSSWVVIIR